ncbi:right-handed parallel beta-helix repeat-containing protein [Streptomyces sp. Marseille-Q5077]|uniref:right-handed parallel beta-helix repeat-containing protein n=1 Tax=Streptomyces sp. Marseille-Q5077 TaxID=3418995 RepID=UPI003D023056
MADLRFGAVVSALMVAVSGGAWATAPPVSASASVSASEGGRHSARQLYVAPWGSDGWPGTFERPFATPARAQQAVRARTAGMTSDIVVNLRGGTYRLTAPLRMSQAAGDSGRGGHRVVYQAYGYGTPGQETVTLSGGREIGGWRPDPQRQGVWRAHVGTLETRQLYVGGKRAARASQGDGIPGELKVTGTGLTTTSAAPRGWRAPQDMELRFRFDYLEGRCGIAGITRGPGDGSTITMDQPCWRMARELYGPDLLALPSDVENSPDFLDSKGSWYLDRSRAGHHELLYRPRAGEDMRRAQVTAPVLETLVSGTGSAGRPVHDIAFKGLTFAHAGWTAPSEPAGFAAAWSMYLRPGKGDDLRLLTVPGNVAFRTAERITFQGNRFVHLGAQGLEFSENSSHNTVDGNVFTDISDGGVVLGALPPETRGTDRGNRITGNRVHRTGADYHASSGIWDAGSRETTISHNQVDHVPYSGILSGPAEDVRGLMSGNRIVGNRVFATNRLLADGGGIYLRGEQGTSYADGAVVSGNTVTDSAYGPWNVGIYTDDSSKWITVRDNAVHSYRASIGGCSEDWGNRPVQNVRFHGNFWDDTVPDWLPRRSYPGGWPPAPDCGDPKNLEFRHNTVLTPDDPASDCAARPACAAIVERAGPGEPYRRSAGLQ